MWQGQIGERKIRPSLITMCFHTHTLFQLHSITSQLLWVCAAPSPTRLCLKPKTMFTHRPTFGKTDIRDLLPKFPIMCKEHIVLSKPALRPNICSMHHHITHSPQVWTAYKHPSCLPRSLRSPQFPKGRTHPGRAQKFPVEHVSAL